MPATTVARYVPRELGRRYKLKLDEFATPLADRIYCPTPDCGVWIPPAHIATAARIARCRNGHETCTACRQPAHGRGAANRDACPEASAEDRRHQQLADELAREEGWRHCIRCAVLIEHREACQHMTCRCGAEFCYVCGRAWRTCHCDMEDLQRLKSEAQARREQRSAREARERERVRREQEAADAELAELRDALAQIAAFEQRERERMRRVQHVQRARLQRLRTKREAALRAEVAAKYAELRAALTALTARQAAAAAAARREERASLRLSLAHQQAEAVARQQNARAEAAAAAADAVRVAERHWQRDYRDRLALETQLERDYEHALVLSAGGAARGELGELPLASIRGAEAALAAYQRTNDARLAAYCAWRDRALAQARWAADEARSVREEEAAARVAALQTAGRRQRRALAQRHAGERLWCRAVAAERVRLLAEMETVEQGLGLAGSTSEADANLLLLLDLEARGALGNEGDGENNTVGAMADDDTQMNHLYAMMLTEAVGDVDDAELAGSGGVVVEDDDGNNVWIDVNDNDNDDNDHESFYSAVHGSSGSGSGRSGGVSLWAEQNRLLVL